MPCEDDRATASARAERVVSAPPSVLDRRGRPLRELRVSVTDRCNFRCSYCMPADVFGAQYAFLPREELLSFEEIARLTAIAVRDLGVRKVRLTGGEPLMRRDLPTLVRMLAQIDGLSDLTLTTNGHMLAEQARALADAGLRRITVSLDALDESTFRHMNGGRGEVARVLSGIDAAAAVGLQPIKINCVVVRGVNEHVVEPLARFFRGTGHIIRFIEYMDVGTVNGWHAGAVFSVDEIRACVERVAPLAPSSEVQPGQVAERFVYRDGGGEVGIIASVTRPFCGECNRARLSADGRLLTCLFAASGTSLLQPLRAGASDAELLELWANIWRQREDRYSELRAASGTGNLPRRRLEMYQIGG